MRALEAPASAREVAFGVLPIESSLSGPVNETHDLLYESPLSINGETILPIRHCLVGPAVVAAYEEPGRGASDATGNAAGEQRPAPRGVGRVVGAPGVDQGALLSW